MSSTDLFQGLRSDYQNAAFRSSETEARLQSWADSQIQAVYSIAYAITSASRSLLLMKVNMMQLLEIALSMKWNKAPDTLQPCSVDSLVDLLPSVTSFLVVMSLITTLNVVLKVIVLVVRFDFFYDVASWPTGTDDILFMCLRRCQLLKVRNTAGSSGYVISF
ncbi:hypothetical protein GBA52_012203 [Prunus armeniaca]|nr:hypothetical protein GBA52_012203 [Prunus armeniaca]